MFVISETEQNQMQTRGVPEKDPQSVLVLDGGLVGNHLSMNAMNIIHRDGNSRKQSFRNHAVIAVGAAGRNTAFVASKQMNSLPIHT
jgi:hypothetical protein